MPARERTHKKKYGVYYTPKDIVSRVLSALFERWRGTHGDALIPEILDPSCGDGEFLANAYELLSRRTGNKNISEHFYGVDIDERAVEETRRRLCALAGNGRTSVVINNIRAGDALVDDHTIAGARAFSWDTHFPGRCFSMIVGNPPWVSLKGKHGDVTSPADLLAFYRRTYTGDSYRPNLFELFLRRSLMLLADNGYLGMVLPDRLCQNRQYSALRRMILSMCTIHELWTHIRFPGMVGDAMVLILQHRPSPDGHTVLMTDDASGVHYIVAQHSFTDPDYSWRLPLTSAVRAIEHAHGAMRLSSWFRSSTGFIARSGTLTETRQSDAMTPAVKGADIGRFTVHRCRFFTPDRKNIIGGTSDIKKLSVPHKVLVRKTGNEIIAAYDENGVLPEQSLYFMTGESDRLKVMCLLLNSKLISYYYRQRLITNRDSMPHLKKYDLDRLPVCFPEHINEWLSFYAEIARSPDDEQLIRRLNDMVYKLYELNQEDTDIIERT